jgi:hypothetical protein
MALPARLRRYRVPVRVAALYDIHGNAPALRASSTVRWHTGDWSTPAVWECPIRASPAGLTGPSLGQPWSIAAAPLTPTRWRGTARERVSESRVV